MDQVSTSNEVLRLQASLTCLGSAMQSDRFTVLVGSGANLREFKVARDLLCRYSPIIKSMCTLPFEEADKQVIHLPEEAGEMFSYFIMWIHAVDPSIDSNITFDVLIDLAIFAEKYHVCHLKNQTSNIIEQWLTTEAKLLTPDIVQRVYDWTAGGSILRKICSRYLQMRVDVMSCNFPTKSGHKFSTVT